MVYKQKTVQVQSLLVPVRVALAVTMVGDIVLPKER